jgi:hypothetical protein
MGGATLCGIPATFAIQKQVRQQSPEPDVRRVLAMFKCHFDAGFIDTQAHIVGLYFREYFPLAIATAQRMRDMGSHHYAWITGFWLLYEYLEQAAPEDRR